MPKISLTDFIDIVAKSGTPKATKVKQVKRRPDYLPANDFYKPLREQLVEIHRGAMQKQALSIFLGNIADPKKAKNYPSAVSGYSRWWGTKQVVWFTPRRALYTNQGIDVIVNPELGLTFNGQRHLIKLYFKSELLSIFKADIITALLEETLRPSCASQETMCVLDVRHAKLFSYRAAKATIAIVQAELAYIGALWNAL